MQYSRIEVLEVENPIIIRKSENINKLEVMLMNIAPNIFADVNGVILSSDNGLTKILFDAGEGRVFNHDFVVQKYKYNNTYQRLGVFIVKTIYEE